MSKSLWVLKAGESAHISNYGNGLEDGYENRLKDLGFHKGQSVTCLQAPKLGAPRIYKLNNSIYALDEQTAREVHCE